MMKISLSWLLGCTGMLVAAVAPVRADEVRLIFGTTSPPVVPVNRLLFKSWVEKVNAEGKGVLVIEQRDDPSIASPLNFYDRVMNDVVQMAFGVLSSVAGKFEKSLVIGFPFVAENAGQPSVAYWRLFKTGLLGSDFDETAPLMLSSFAPGSLHFRSVPDSLDSLRGLKVTAGTKTTAQVAARLGAAPVTLSWSETYSALQRGTVDAVAIAWAAFPAVKLYEVTHHHVMNASLGTAPNSVFMSKKRYEALPEAARKIIDANSGERQSREMGTFWDSQEDEALKFTRTRPNQSFVSLTPNQFANWRREADFVASQWAKTVPDGERLLATYREILAKVKLEDLDAAKR